MDCEQSGQFYKIYWDGGGMYNGGALKIKYPLVYFDTLVSKNSDFNQTKVQRREQKLLQCIFLLIYIFLLTERIMGKSCGKESNKQQKSGKKVLACLVSNIHCLSGLNVNRVLSLSAQCKQWLVDEANTTV